MQIVSCCSITNENHAFLFPTVLDPLLLSPYPDHLLPHLSKLQTFLFNMQHPAFGINSLTLSVGLIHILVFHLLTTLDKSDPHCHHHLCPHQSLLFFTLDLKHTSSSKVFSTVDFTIDTLWTDLTDSRPDRFSFAHRFCFSF